MTEINYRTATLILKHSYPSVGSEQDAFDICMLAYSGAHRLNGRYRVYWKGNRPRPIYEQPPELQNQVVNIAAYLYDLAIEKRDKVKNAQSDLEKIVDETRQEGMFHEGGHYYVPDTAVVGANGKKRRQRR